MVNAVGSQGSGPTPNSMPWMVRWSGLFHSLTRVCVFVFLSEEADLPNRGVVFVWMWLLSPFL